MVTGVLLIDDPARVLQEAAVFLGGDPVRHNVILTLLHARVTSPEPGRYWVVDVDGTPGGVVFQSPLDFFATVTPMEPEAVVAVVDSIVQGGVVIPGVNGVAATAARFAGHWTERMKSAANPVEGARIYEVDEVLPAPPTAGALRLAEEADRHLLIEWSAAFQLETGDGAGNVERTVDRRLQAGQLWIWEDTEAAAMSGITDPVAGVVRIGPVYTPPDRRGQGYASALVARVSAAARRRGHRCILYTQLANPTSNSIYRALGYRAVDEVLRYKFLSTPGS
jgi:predicted GNAT family acetyltransferase